MNKVNFSLRIADDNDVHGIMKLMEAAITDSKHSKWFVSDDEEYVREHLEDHGFVIVAETEAEEIAGFFLVKYPDLSDNLGSYLGFSKEMLCKVVVMDSTVVGSAWRGNGLQGRMLEKAEQLIDRERFSYLMCTVHPENIYSLGNMKRHGYKVMTTAECYGGFIRHILMKEI